MSPSITGPESSVAMAAPLRQTRIPKLPATATPSVKDIQSLQAKNPARSRTSSRASSPTSKTKSPSRPPWKVPGFDSGLPPYPEYRSSGQETPISASFLHRLSSAIPAPKGKFFSSSASARKVIPIMSKAAEMPGDSVAEATWYGSTKIPLIDLMRAQNIHVERSPAQVGERRCEKLVISLNNPYGRPVRFMCPSPIDWADAGRIKALNRWRSQIFKHYLGTEESVTEINPDALVAAFEYRELEKKAEKLRLKVGREWPTLARSAKAINGSFEGRKLVGETTLHTLRGACQIALEDCGVDIEEQSITEGTTISSRSSELPGSRASTLATSLSEVPSRASKTSSSGWEPRQGSVIPYRNRIPIVPKPAQQTEIPARGLNSQTERISRRWTARHPSWPSDTEHEGSSMRCG